MKGWVLHTSPMADTNPAPSRSAMASRPLWEKKIRYLPWGVIRLTAPGARALPASTRIPSRFTRYREVRGAEPFTARLARVFRKAGQHRS